MLRKSYAPLSIMWGHAMLTTDSFPVYDKTMCASRATTSIRRSTAYDKSMCALRTPYPDVSDSCGGASRQEYLTETHGLVLARKNSAFDRQTKCIDPARPEHRHVSRICIAVASPSGQLRGRAGAGVGGQGLERR